MSERCERCGGAVYVDRFATRSAGSYEQVWRHEATGRTYCAPAPIPEGFATWCCEER